VRRTISAESRTLWLALLPLGLGAWVPAWAGLRVGRLSWCAQGAACSIVVLTGWILNLANPHRAPSFAGDLILLGWIGAMVSAYLIHHGSRAD
jgi:hypothetical protein